MGIRRENNPPWETSFGHKTGEIPTLRGLSFLIKTGRVIHPERPLFLSPTVKRVYERL